MSPLEINSITQKIIGCAYDVSNTLGIGFVEKVYENALTHRIRKTTGFKVEQQYPIKVVYDGIIVGEFFADFLVANQVLVELKAVSMLTNDHTAQALNYLRATGLEVCLLINFGKTKIEVKRFRPNNDWQQKQF